MTMVVRAAPPVATEVILRGCRRSPSEMDVASKDVMLTAGRELSSRRMAEGGEEVQLGTGVVEIGETGCPTQLGLCAHPDTATKRLALPPLQKSL